MRIDSVIYWETEEDKNKRNDKNGILINNGTGPLLDLEGNKVNECWDYRRTEVFVITVFE